MMARPEYAGRSLVLIAFAVVGRTADAAGDLPRRSLAAVADQLSGRGLHVEVARALASRPHAEAEGDEAREHRRRVEVWVR
ncbi:MAG TPA: hypothetical protein VKU41_30685 [Polyangiaceae bacterium]|nr:hypothetical protein [Polyangiaceae bacterium]